MATATVITKLPLDTFAQIAGIHPCHFNQVVVDDIYPGLACGEPYVAYSWQNTDRTGREDIAQTIADVESQLEDYLNFALVPTYYANRPIVYPHAHTPSPVGYGVAAFGYSSALTDARGMVRAAHLGRGYAISGGREAKVFLAGNAPVMYADPDGDTYPETAIIAVNVPAGTLASDIALYYPGNGGADVFEIRPISVSLDSLGTTATIRCRREQLVRYEFLSATTPRGVDGLDGNNFLSLVDVYQHGLDVTQPHVEFRWEGGPCGFGYTYGAGAAQYSIQSGAMLVRDAKLGWASLQPAHWDAASGQFLWDNLCAGRLPDSARAWFLAGWPRDSRGAMDNRWARAVTYLALSKMDRPLCACESINSFTDYWGFDFAKNAPDHSQQISRRKLDCPLGTTRAALYVWDMIVRDRLPDTEVL